MSKLRKYLLSRYFCLLICPKGQMVLYTSQLQLHRPLWARPKWSNEAFMAFWFLHVLTLDHAVAGSSMQYRWDLSPEDLPEMTLVQPQWVGLCFWLAYSDHSLQTALDGWVYGVLRLRQHWDMLHGREKRSPGSGLPSALFDRSQGIFTLHASACRQSRTAPLFLTQLGVTAGSQRKLSWEIWPARGLNPRRSKPPSSRGL